MSQDVLTALQDSWGIPKAEAMQPIEPMPELPPAKPVDTGTGTLEKELVPFSCEWIGRKYTGRVVVDPEAGEARLIELMKRYPIKPHLNEGGGSGFSHPYGDWYVKHWHIISEFSELWFTMAGDIIIEKYGHRMAVHPQRRRPEVIAEQSKK